MLFDHLNLTRFSALPLPKWRYTLHSIRCQLFIYIARVYDIVTHLKAEFTGTEQPSYEFTATCPHDYRSITLISRLCIFNFLYMFYCIMNGL
ncbi:hypothetical protein E2542_SST28297 [Spatholobus suberectus]|nr:hypothetical protein E2542_SST28297 [Spatholobus suberectus]